MEGISKVVGVGFQILLTPYKEKMVGFAFRESLAGSRGTDLGGGLPTSKTLSARCFY